ncbi:MAG: hypothetical protein QGH06_01930 [Lutibacter sp.]|jgi:hypothetical protein|nr:hypothetical protein [Lutibacter sp.]
MFIALKKFLVFGALFFVISTNAQEIDFSKETKIGTVVIRAVNKMEPIDLLKEFRPGQVFLKRENFLQESQVNRNYEINQTLVFGAYRFLNFNVNDFHVKHGKGRLPRAYLQKRSGHYIFESYSEQYRNLDMKKAFFDVSELYRR